MCRYGEIQNINNDNDTKFVSFSYDVWIIKLIEYELINKILIFLKYFKKLKKFIRNRSRKGMTI